MMFIRLTLVAALMAFVSATTTNLRSGAENALLTSEVMDSDLTAKFVASFMKQSETLTKKAHGEHAKFGKLAVEAKTMKNSNTELMELRKGGGEKYVSDGYFVQKFRSNSDCSGNPRNYFGEKLGNCITIESGSARSACVNNYGENMVYDIMELYQTSDCSGAPYYVGLVNDPQPECGLDLDGYHENLAFSSKSNRCFPGTKGLDLPPGLMVTSHSDSNCQDSPIAYDNTVVNGCFPMFEGNPKNLSPDSEYYYVKYTSCSPTDIEMTMYSDSSCLRPVMKRTMKNHPFNGQCMQAGPDVYVQYTCTA